MILKLIPSLALHAVLVSGLAGYANADKTRTVTVKFAPGADSSKVSGHITGRESVLYKLNARDGQFLTVSLQSKSPSVGFNVYIPGRGPGDEALFSSEPGGRNYAGQLYKTGDHSVSVFLNRAAARQGKAADFDLIFRITAKPPAEESPAPPDAKTVFGKTVSYGDITFKVTSPQSATNNKFTITPSGLAASNDPITIETTDLLVDVMTDDMDGDNSPEVAVITGEKGGSRRHAHVFTTFARRSFGMVNFPEVTNDKLLAGYQGGDEFQFVENTFIRRFPLTGQGAAKTRQLQFKLKPGEAMKQLVLDRHIDF